MAKCVWPRAAWIEGDGGFALLARCGVLTVTLWPTPEEAEKAKAMIDHAGCGGHCRGAPGHEIVELVRSP